MRISLPISCLALIATTTLMAQPVNDNCADALPVAVNTTVAGDLEGATTDANPPCGPLAEASRGVWFTVIGDGRRIRVSVRSPSEEAVEGIAVFFGDCDLPDCFAGAEAPGQYAGTNAFTWCGEPGVMYRIFVAGHENAPQQFTLRAEIEPNACPMTPDNDNCSDAEPIFGPGIFEFDNTAAQYDGEADCPTIGSGPDVPYDVWYCWMASESGTATVDTCGFTTVDTKIVIYEGCDCQSSVDLACDDHGCGGQQSRVRFEAEENTSYLIRVGTYPFRTAEARGGSGSFAVTYESLILDEFALDQVAHCQPPDQWNARLSNGVSTRTLDNFSPTASGSVSSLSWRGVYFDGFGDCFVNAVDAFEVRYFLDEEGMPGPLIAGPYKQQNLGLLFTLRNRLNHRLMGVSSEYEYSATHAAVPVLAGESYWVEIINSVPGVCDWYWEVGRGRDSRSITGNAPASAANGFEHSQVMHEDLAFCLDAELGAIPATVPSPVNDECEAAAPIADGESLEFDTTAATTSLIPWDAQYCFTNQTCFLLGGQQIHNDVWFRYDGSCTSDVRLELCESTFDTRITVMRERDCLHGLSVDEIVVVNDDGCAPDQLPAPQPLTDAANTNTGDDSTDFPPSSDSDCYETHLSPGCDNETCSLIVCALSPYCCTQAWYETCMTFAVYLCRDSIGDGLQSHVSFRAESNESFLVRAGGYGSEAGVGRIDVSAGPVTPTADTLLTDYSEFSECVLGPCPNASCLPPPPMSNCCKLKDYTNDGAIDLADYAVFSRLVEHQKRQAKHFADRLP